MDKLLGKLGRPIAAPLLRAATLFPLILAVFLLMVPEPASAQIWVTSGFELTPPTQVTVSGITFYPGNKTETAYCNTSAFNPATGQLSPAAADYRSFYAGCTLTPSTGTTIVPNQCPAGYEGNPSNFPSGNPAGECDIVFQPQPGVTYTVTSKHALDWIHDTNNADCAQPGVPAFYDVVCFSDPLG